MPSRNFNHAMRALTQRRSILAEAAGDANIPSDTLVRYVNNIREMEGEVRAWTVIESVWTRSKEHTEAERRFKVAEVVANLLTSNMGNDTYSGRTNDAVRAYNDGIRYVCNHISTDNFMVVE